MEMVYERLGPDEIPRDQLTLQANLLAGTYTVWLLLRLKVQDSEVCPLMTP